MLSLFPLAADVQADALALLLSDGVLQLFAADGTLLAELRFGGPAFEPAANGAMQARPIKSDLDARGDGRAAMFLCMTASGQPLMQGSVGRLGADDKADLVMNSVEIRRGAEVAVDEFLYQIPTETESD